MHDGCWGGLFILVRSSPNSKQSNLAPAAYASIFDSSPSVSVLCNATQRKHPNSHSQARCPVAAEGDGFCACVPDSRPPCVFIHGNKAARAWPLFVGG